MKKRDILKCVGIASAVLLLSACSKRGSSYQMLPQCSDDLNDASASYFVPNKGAKIEAKEPNTAIRVWHYINGDKMVCTLTGCAAMKEK